MLESLRTILSEIVFSCRVLSQAREATVAEVDGFVDGPLATALAEAEARGYARGLKEADSREADRILGLSETEVIAEIEAEGRNPEALAEAMRGQMGATFKLCEEIKTLRDALAPFAAILANGEPVGPIPRGLLDSKLTRQDLRNATAAYRATNRAEMQKPEEVPDA